MQSFGILLAQSYLCAMLTLPFLRENTATAVAGLEKKHVPNAAEAVAKILDLDAQRRTTQQESDALAAEANQRSKQIGALMQQGQKEQAEALRAQVAEQKDKLKAMADAVIAALG
jgi:seryl-tRNA synthetase